MMVKSAMSHFSAMQSHSAFETAAETDNVDTEHSARPSSQTSSRKKTAGNRRINRRLGSALSAGTLAMT
ncbi:MAG: hypothetical protein AAGJ80_18440, partial [Cyanobacteria bacterium J06553_1]